MHKIKQYEWQLSYCIDACIQLYNCLLSPGAISRDIEHCLFVDLRFPGAEASLGKVKMSGFINQNLVDGSTMCKLPANCRGIITSLVLDLQLRGHKNLGYK
jgi:hypothetical protein